MGAIKEVRVPDIGDFKEIPVIEIMVKPGDTVKPEDSLIVLESDKATLDVPAPFGGAIKTLKVQVGDKVSRGSVILELEAGETDIQLPPRASPALERPPESATADVPAKPPAFVAAFDSGAASQRGLAHASPSIRRFARELGVDLERVSGTGPKQRILKEDVQTFVRGAIAESRSAPPGSVLAVGGAGASSLPGADAETFGPVERRPLSEAMRSAGANLHRNWVSIPHVIHFDEADITDLDAFRRQVSDSVAESGIEITLLPFLIKAAAAALKRFPEFNASLDGGDLVLKRYYHIGFAIATPEGRVVPVIRDADQKGVLDIARDMADLSSRAWDSTLTPADVAGGTFTLADVGSIGGTGFTPIIEGPQVAILGIARPQPRLIERLGTVITRQMLPLALSYDHRVIDGTAAARFLAWLGGVVADLRRAAL